MECLYKLETNYCFKEYQKFNWAVLHKKRFLILFSLVYLLVVFESFVLKIFVLESYYRIIVILLPILLIASFFLSNMSIKKIYKSNKLVQVHEVTFEFYDTYFIIRTIRSEMKVEYCLLHKVIETKTNFYPMISQIQGYILPKEQFPEGLENFLRSKFPKSK